MPTHYFLIHKLIYTFATTKNASYLNVCQLTNKLLTDRDLNQTPFL